MQIQCEQADQFSVGGDQRLGIHLSQLPLEYPWDRGCNTQDKPPDLGKHQGSVACYNENLKVGFQFAT